MKASKIQDVTVNKANCDWIIEKAKELKTLISYESASMVRANKTRALSSIQTMRDSMNELEAFISEVED